MAVNWGTPLTIAVEWMWSHYKTLPRKRKKAVRSFVMGMKESARKDLARFYGENPSKP